MSGPCKHCGKVWQFGTCDSTVSRRARCERMTYDQDRADASEGIPRYAMLDVWMALGGDPLVFETWMDEPRRTPADAWAQLLGAIRDPVRLLRDTNPPAGVLVDIAMKHWGRAT